MVALGVARPFFFFCLTAATSTARPFVRSLLIALEGPHSLSLLAGTSGFLSVKDTFFFFFFVFIPPTHHHMRHRTRKRLSRCYCNIKKKIRRE